MALKTKTKGGGAYFDAKEYVKAKAVLIEVHDFLKDQPNGNFEGKRDVAIADITIFPTTDSLNGDAEVVFMPRVQITGKGLTSDLEGEEGEQLAYGLEIKPNKKAGYRPFPVWRELDESVSEKVAAYLESRDAKLANAVANAPAGLFD